MEGVGLTPVALAQTSSQTFRPDLWTILVIVLDPTIIGGTAILQTVNIIDGSGVNLFSHTFKQAFTINVTNPITSVTFSEATNQTYTINMWYQQTSAILVPSFSYLGIAPFTLATTAYPYTAPTVQTVVNGSVPTSGATFTMTFTANAAGYAYFLIKVGSPVTWTTNPSTGSVVFKLDGTTVYTTVSATAYQLYADMTTTGNQIGAVTGNGPVTATSHTLTMVFASGAISGSNTGYLTVTPYTGGNTQSNWIVASCDTNANNLFQCFANSAQTWTLPFQNISAVSMAIGSQIAGGTLSASFAGWGSTILISDNNSLLLMTFSPGTATAPYAQTVTGLVSAGTSITMNMTVAFSASAAGYGGQLGVFPFVPTVTI